MKRISEDPREPLRRRALAAILEHAFFRWESAVIIAGTLLLSFFGPAFPGVPAQPWIWLAGASLAEAAIVAATLNDPVANAAAVAKMLRGKQNMKSLRDRANQARVERALEYQQRIEQAVQAQPDGVMRERLAQIASDVNDWVARIYSLALRSDSFQFDDIVKRDLRDVPAEIQRKELELLREDDASVRTQIEQTLKSKRQQLASLQNLENTMQKATNQLEQTLAALGTVYSQLLLVSAKDIDSGRDQRLRAEIAEQVATLQDLTSSLDEVYQQPDALDAELEAMRARLGTQADAADTADASTSTPASTTNKPGARRQR